jgi:DNA anti-recombination protein RmuC
MSRIAAYGLTAVLVAAPMAAQGAGSAPVVAKASSHSFEETRQAFERQARERLHALDRKADALEKKVKQQGSKASAASREKLDALEERREDAAEKLDDLRDATEDDWEEVRTQAEKSLDPLEQAYRDATGSRS